MGQQMLPQSHLIDSKASGEDGFADKVPEDLPFLGGWLGWLGYDCAWEIEQLPWLKEDPLPFPVAFWYEPAEFAVLDHVQQRLWLAAETMAGLTRMVERLATTTATTTDSDLPRKISADTSIYIDEYLASDDSEPTAGCRTYGLQFETDQAEFEQAVMKAKAHIRAGDVFQVNHSLRFQAKTTLSSWQVYRKLHSINPSPFASYWHTPWGDVVSCSPERLVHLQAGVAQSRPIAGTRPRGKTVGEDAAIALELKGDRKERAEHIMLVDLARNDLGRVCQWGSMQVSELMTIERYSHVMHLVSNVVGVLGDERSAAALVAALFPGGTITGCPKVRCMEIIEALEPVRRSLFYGSCGYFDRRGRLDLNILIRTLLMTSTVELTADCVSGPTAEDNPVQTVWGQVGAGIVADSEPTREWQESLQKAKAQLLALGL
jgi:para-aminobenzoate synthetase component I